MPEHSMTDIELSVLIERHKEAVQELLLASFSFVKIEQCLDTNGNKQAQVACYATMTVRGQTVPGELMCYGTGACISSALTNCYLDWKRK